MQLLNNFPVRLLSHLFSIHLFILLFHFPPTIFSSSCFSVKQFGCGPFPVWHCGGKELPGAGGMFYLMVRRQVLYYAQWSMEKPQCPLTCCWRANCSEGAGGCLMWLFLPVPGAGAGSSGAFLIADGCGSQLGGGLCWKGEGVDWKGLIQVVLH